MAERIRVEVAYARPERQWLLALELPAGALVGDAFEASGLARELAGPADFGIHGRPVAADTRLRDGDRVELYRPLSFDPKESRRRRAAHAARKPDRAQPLPGSTGDSGSVPSARTPLPGS